jgi:NitT/TauT family transport system substrate-binding protein
MGSTGTTGRARRLAAAGALISAAVATGPAGAQEAVKIGVYPGQTFHMNVYVADAKGFYKEAGLVPEFVTVGTGPLMNSMLGSGAIEVAFQPPTNVAVAKEQGLDQVYVMGNIAMPYVVVGKKDLKLPNRGRYPGVIADLKGLNWGITGRGADSEMFMRAMATDAKLDPDKDMTFVGVGLSPTALPALKAGRIDAFITLSPGPIVASALGLGEVIVDLRKGEGPANFRDVTYQGVTMLRKTAQARPKVVDGLVAAHAKAYCWIRNPANMPELLSILKTKLAVSELTPAQFEQAVKDEIPIIKMTFQKEHFGLYNDMMLRLKTIKGPLSPDETLWKSVPTAEPRC